MEAIEEEDTMQRNTQHFLANNQPHRTPPKGFHHSVTIADVTIETNEGPEVLPVALLTKQGTWMGVTADGVQWTDIEPDQILSWKAATVIVQQPGEGK